jgi:hypothetical protein
VDHVIPVGDESGLTTAVSSRVMLVIVALVVRQDEVDVASVPLQCERVSVRVARKEAERDDADGEGRAERKLCDRANERQRTS